jgi:hypothetical protein
MGRIQVPKSTKSNPLGFFEGLVNSNHLELLRREFHQKMENLQHNGPASFIKFDFRNLTYQQKVKVLDKIPIESKNGTEIIENTFYVTRTFSLDSDLKNLFKEEVDNSVELINDYINSAADIQQAKLCCRILIEKLKIITKEFTHTPYHQILRDAIKPLLQHIKSFGTLYNQEDYDKPRNKNTPRKTLKILKLNPLLKELMQLESDTADDSVQLFNGDKVQENYFINSIAAVCNRRKIASNEIPVTEWNKEPVAYIFTKLKKHLSKFEIKSVLNFQPLKFKDKNFFKTPDNISTCASKFSKKNSPLKKEIDKLFAKHIK